ncbi:MAG: hypothetical protein EOO27_06195 [Comamonadaceae bacterium]|nr:MAG: hypothetical protein EOO27_06195 [Comamonadaceae bacterium]
MSQEKIEVIYAPIGTAGIESFHGTLLYTDSKGQQFYAAGTYSNFLTLSDDIKRDPINATKANISALGWGIFQGSYGTLTTYTGIRGDANQIKWGSPWFNSTVKTQLASGPDLSNKWAVIKDAMKQMTMRIWCTVQQFKTRILLGARLRRLPG